MVAVRLPLPCISASRYNEDAKFVVLVSRQEISMTISGIKVLYVEDEPAIAELLRSGLDLFGIDVSPIYGNAEDALDKILSGKPPMNDCKLLVFDIRLPGMTGMELAERLRSAGEQRPILIVSAYQPPQRTQLEKLDAHFMPKPFDFAGIVSKIQELVN
jgi:two-component system response regulator MprA